MNDNFYTEIQKRLDKNSEEPLYKQVSSAVREAIENGLLMPGEKLPPIRKLSDALEVNNVTIISAYKYLESKKFVYSITGSGTYVSESGLEIAPYSLYNKSNKVLTEYNINKQIKNSDMVNFAKSSVSPELFPVEEFKELFDHVLMRDKGHAFGYEQNQGYEPLRQGLCSYLACLGIKTSADKLQIISGAQQGIDIISKALLYPNDCVLTENPTYYGAVGAFLSRGAKVYGVPMEKDGIDISELTSLLKLHRPKFLYIMSYYQTPTCISYSIEKKRTLIELASKYDFYIIEEDNQSDFNYTQNPVVPLKTLDYKNRVIYLKSFSKLLMPGLRLSFMVLPKPVLNKVSTAKYTTDIDTSGFLQRAFSLFIETGGWNRHISKMNAVFQKRYDTFITIAEKQLQSLLPFDEPHGGLSVWCRIPEKINLSSGEFAQKLADGGVVVTPGDIFALHDTAIDYIRISFADIEEQDINSSIERLINLMLDLF